MRWVSLILAFSNFAYAQTSVTTQRYNSSRSGVNSTEFLLNHQTVAKNFGKLFELQVEGEIYAQPLYIPGLKLADGSKHNAVIVAAMDSFLYAFDADHAPNRERPWLWRRYLGSSHHLTHDAPIPWAGILSTPVIDVANGVIFANCLVSGSHGNATYRLSRIALESGAVLKSLMSKAGFPELELMLPSLTARAGLPSMHILICNDPHCSCIRAMCISRLRVTVTKVLFMAGSLATAPQI